LKFLLDMKAIDEDRIILTHDLDFGRMVALSGQGLPSVVIFRLADMQAAEVNRHLLDVLARFSEQATRPVDTDNDENCVGRTASPTYGYLHISSNAVR
jgi:hypothetical protein